MPAQFWESLLSATAPWSTSDGSALANTTTETIISPSSPDFTFPANWFYPGAVLRVTAAGEISTTGSPTFTFQLRYGGVSGTSLISTGALTQGTTQTRLAWRFEAIVACRSIGTSGTVVPEGLVTWNTTTSAGTTLAVPQTIPSPATVTVDTTTAKALVLTGAWSAASASNTATCHQWLIESLD